MIPTINYDNFAANLIPPQKRLRKWYGWMRGLLSQVKWLYNLFGNYVYGSVYPIWIAGTVYASGYFVQYGFSVYQSTQNNNVGNTPGNTQVYSGTGTYNIGNSVQLLGVYYQCNTTISSPEIFNPAHWTVIPNPIWYPVNANFLGALERGQFNFQKLTFEYALNAFFGTVFRNPTAWTGSGAYYSPTSDIYITTNVPAYVTMGLGCAPQPLGILGTASTGIGLGCIYIGGTGTTFLFTIHIPSAVYSSLGANALQIVSSIADLYNLSGINYEIVTY